MPPPLRILGVSAFYHDSAAALVRDGEIVAAAQEERFTRKKHDADFPSHAVAYCLEAEGVTLKDVDYVVFYDKPFLKFERLLETYLAMAPRGLRSFQMSIPLWIRQKLFQKTLLQRKLRTYGEFDWERNLLFTEHHLSHAASAFFPSPFQNAAVLTMDGVGEWATTSAGVGDGNNLQIVKEIHFPHSMGLLYSAFTYYTGFKVNSGEYKLMGLAPYGRPKYAGLIVEKLVDLKPDGSFRLNLEYLNYCTGLTMTNARFALQRVSRANAMKPSGMVINSTPAPASRRYESMSTRSTRPKAARPAKTISAATCNSKQRRSEHPRKATSGMAIAATMKSTVIAAETRPSRSADARRADGRAQR